MLGVCTGMTTGIWKITHVHGHHVEHKIGSLTDRGYVRYLHVDDTAPFSHFAAVCHALRTAPIQLILPLFVLARRSFSDSSFRRKFYRYYLGEAALVYGLVGIFFWLDAAKSIFYFGVIYSIVYLESRHVDYITHTFSRGDSKLSLSNVCTHPRYNKTFWNFGYHIVHHIHPAAHWTSLPAFYKQLEISEHSIPIGRRANILRLFAPATFSWHRVGERTGH
jgi:fatty acid desaturase